MLTIGQLATASGVPTSTIRFWERRDLLVPAARSGGQRRYTEDALAQVGLLRLCQDAGFTLTEIRQVLAQRAADPTRWRELVEAKMVDVATSLRKLRKAYDLLSHALECTHDDIVKCPRFQAAVENRATATGRTALAG
ncbi:MAG TPA: MerR family transcriptional regulator [Pseudonocardiaceae bacterium]|nr:MerR family transcriptional regulator [Pseudonocardiaceae bacterium]